jgi:hypothetical protein
MHKQDQALKARRIEEVANGDINRKPCYAALKI